MLIKICTVIVLLIFSLQLHAQKITGIVKDNNGSILPGVAIYINGLQKNVVTNDNGFYSIIVDAGNYTLTAKAVGYTTQNKNIIIQDSIVVVDFILDKIVINENDVVIRSGENLANSIIRNAIKKRDAYNNEIAQYSAKAYIKSNTKLLKVPKKLMGQKIDAKEADSSGKSLISLTESITKIDYKKPNQYKFTVLSGRTSGSNSGFGANFPIFTNFYEQLINIGEQLNPRGFVSPIHNNAFHYYKYKLLGTFFENNEMVNIIRIIPKRKNEPLFIGTIMIYENSWRIHSIDVVVSKGYELQLVDTIRISQLQMQIAENIWRPRNQIINANIKLFGFNVAVNYTSVLDSVDINPVFSKNHFKKEFMRYTNTFNTFTPAYWDSIRPIPLDTIEVKDYLVKDSMFNAMQLDSVARYKKADSTRKANNVFKLKKILYTPLGYTYTFYKKFLPAYSIHINPLLLQLSYNTVEGLTPKLQVEVRKYYNNKTTMQLSYTARYGVSNKRYNGYATCKYDINNRHDIEVNGGSWVKQWNQNNPISELINSSYTLFYKRNYMKTYESHFATIKYGYNNKLGLQTSLQAMYDNRLPLDNTTTYSFRKKDNVLFTPNYPIELVNNNINKNKAFILEAQIQYQPGVKQIILPKNEVIAIASKKPIFTLAYIKALPNILRSTASYDKWKLSVTGRKNFKLLGASSYYVSAGGFLNIKNITPIDLHHFNGNQTLGASAYLKSFQIAPYYAYSTNAKLFGEAHVEHHFNGLLTNKIPLLNKLKWTLVTASNIFYVNKRNNYAEVSVGLENIFKILRVDFVAGYDPNKSVVTGIRFGVGGIFTR
jgi:hypothetical protein